MAHPGTHTEGEETPSAPSADLGTRIHRLRTERGMTQRQLAEPVCTSAYISTLEAGRARPSDAVLRHIAGRLGLTLDELVTGRPANLATEVRAKLADAQGVLAGGDTEAARAAYASLLAEATDHGLVAERAAALLGLGHCALDAGDLAEARERFEASEDALGGEAITQRVPAIRGRAVTHLLAGELRDACYLLERTIDELNASDLRDPASLLLLYTAVIAPYMDLGVHSRAAHAAELALTLAPQVSDPALVAAMHRTVARTFLAQGRAAEADASLAKAAELYQQLQIRSELAHCHWMRGYVHAQRGALDEAERELVTAHSMLTAGRSSLYATQVEVELADVLRRSGRADEADSLLRNVLVKLHPERGAVHAGGAHRLLGLIADERGDVDEALAHYRAALSLLEHTGATGDLADISRLLGDLLRRTGDIDGALDAYRAGLSHHVAPGTTTLGPSVLTDLPASRLVPPSSGPRQPGDPGRE